VRPKEIVVGNKESNMSVGAFPTAVTIRYLIGELECSVKTLNDLLQPAIFLGDRVVIGETDDLDQVEIHVPQHELLLRKLVGSIAVGSELEGHARELLELGKGHSHGKDAGADITGIRYLIPEDGFLQGIHDEPDIVPDTFNFGVGFVGSKVVGGFVVIGIDEGFHKSSSCFGVIGNCDMRNLDTMYFQESSGSDSGRQSQVDIVCKAKPHDMG